MVVGRVQVTDQFKPDKAIEKHVAKYAKDLAKQLDKVCGSSDVDLEGRFSHLRSQETNIGNFVADIIRTEYPSCDIVMLNTGTLRCNTLYKSGPLKRRLVAEILPMKDKIFLVKMPGKVVKEMFENSVSAYPKLDGRFPAISGMKFTFDAAKPVGERVQSIEVGGEALDEAKEYTVAIKEYISKGKDGFTMLLGDSVKLVMDEDYADILPALVDSVFRRLSPDYVMNPKREEIRATRMKLFNTSADNKDKAGFIKIAPKVDGRIKILNPEDI